MSLSRKVPILKIFLFLLTHVPNSVEKCVMYGATEDEQQAYFYDGPAKPFPEQYSSLLGEVCPMFQHENFTCCHPKQVETARKKLEMAESLFQHCPQCVYNFRILTCQLICSKNQSNFVHAIIAKDNSSLVDAVRYNVSLSFTSRFYDSCKDVRSAFGISMEFICSPCNRSSFLMGLAEQSSLKMIYVENQISQNDSMDSFALNCNETANFRGQNFSKCGCYHCNSLCHVVSPRQDFIIHTNLFDNFFNNYRITLISTYFVCIFMTFILFYKGVFFSCHKPNDDSTIPLLSESESDISSHENLRLSSLRFKFLLAVSKKMHSITLFSATQPLRTLATFLMLIFVCICGLNFMEFTTDPLKIWSNPSGTYRLNQKMYEDNFGRFYRVQQIIAVPKKINTSPISNDDDSEDRSELFNANVVQEIFELQRKIYELTATTIDEISGKEVQIKLDNICFKPLYPKNVSCAFFSVTQYFQNNPEILQKLDEFPNWVEHINYCIENQYSLRDPLFNNQSCLSDFSAPVNPKLVFGGISNSFQRSDSYFITVMLENPSKFQEKFSYPEAWENVFIQFMNSYKGSHIDVYFFSESSIQSELQRVSKSNIPVVTMSYFSMFVYVILSLSLPTGSFKQFLMKNKIIIAFVGIFLVFLSMLCTVGLFSYFRLEVTIITLEVLPFLILAVGLDNIYILIAEFERQEHNLAISRAIANAMSLVGPGMLFSTTLQVLIFSMGTVCPVPAVRWFSAFAATSLLLNFIFQLTAFITIFVIDVKREEGGYLPIFCCFKTNFDLDLTDQDDQNPHSCELNDSISEKILRFYSNLLSNPSYRCFIIFIFSFSWLLSLLVIPNIDIGLDQQLGLPTDSYLQDFFNHFFASSKTGPPTFFVIQPGYSYNLTDLKKICSGKDCDDENLVLKIFVETLYSNSSRLETPPKSWLDAHIAWLESGANCCRFYIENTVNSNSVDEIDFVENSFLHPSLAFAGEKKFCDSTVTNSSSSSYNCTRCLKNGTTAFNLSRKEFILYLMWFLSDIPNSDCVLGGKPMFGNSVNIKKSFDGKASELKSSNFMAYHSPLRNTSDFVNALRNVDLISKNISELLNHPVRAYSPFYIFYEVYLTLIQYSIVLALVSVTIVFLFCLIVTTGNIYLTFVMTLCVSMAISCNLGLMYLLDIHFNPVSMINLLMIIGINVEFLSHLVIKFQKLNLDSDNSLDTSIKTLRIVGSTLFTGITVTKIIGISFLAFSTSILFKKYYFTMYIFSIIIAFLHAVVLLPVFLTFQSCSSYNEEAMSLIDDY